MADTATTDLATEPEQAAVDESSEKPFPYTRVNILTWVVRMGAVLTLMSAAAAGLSQAFAPAAVTTMVAFGAGSLITALIAFAFGGCRRLPDDDLDGDEFEDDEFPYEVPQVVHRDLGEAVREVVDTVRSWDDPELDAAQAAYEAHWTPQVDASAQHVYTALIGHGFLTDEFDPDPRRLDVYIAEMKDTVGGAADVILALYAEDRRLLTYRQFQLLTAWWTETVGPLPERSTHIATAEDLDLPDPAARPVVHPGTVHTPTPLLPGELEEIASTAVDGAVVVAPPPPGPVPNQ